MAVSDIMISDCGLRIADLKSSSDLDPKEISDCGLRIGDLKDNSDFELRIANLLINLDHGFEASHPRCRVRSSRSTFGSLTNASEYC